MPPHTSLFVYGPAFVRAHGKVTSSPFGAKIEQVEVPPAVTLPLYAHKHSEVEIHGEFFESYLKWESFIRLRKKIGERTRILLVGEPDSGKSFVAKILFDLLQLPVLNLDIGQVVLGPPLTISISEVEPVALLQYLPIKKSEFFWTFSLLRERKEYLKRVRRIVVGEGSFIADTPGIVHGKEAVEFNKLLIDLLEPEIIVNVGRKLDWALSLGALHFPFRTPRKKSAKRRRDYRLWALLRYCKQIYDLGFDLKFVRFPKGSFSKEKPEEYFRKRFLGRIVGLYRKGEFLNVGVIEEFLPGTGSFKVRSLLRKEPDEVVLSEAKVSLHKGSAEQR